MVAILAVNTYTSEWSNTTVRNNILHIPYKYNYESKLQINHKQMIDIY